jgi:hypothetical protein
LLLLGEFLVRQSVAAPKKLAEGEIIKGAADVTL